MSYRVTLLRIAPGLLPLIIGMVIGSLWSSEPPALLTAQSPVGNLPPLAKPSLLPDTQEPSTTEKNGEFTEISGASFSGEVGERVTVVEARGGRDVAGSGGLIGFSHVDSEGTQVITIVDAEKRWMAVYHVDSRGTIRLASSREIAADFTLQLNATAPLPDQIRRLQGISPRSN